METAFVRPQAKPNTTLARKARDRSGQRGGQKNRKRTPNEGQGKLVIFRAMLENTVTKRRFSYTGAISSTAGGAVTLVSPSVSGAIAGLGVEWVNFAQEYQEFRVLSLKYYFAPATVNATSSTGPYQGFMLSSPWAQFVPTTIATIQQSKQLVKFSTLEEKEVQVSPAGFANAKLWNTVGVALPADRDFGLTYVSVGALAVSSVIFYVLAELEAEFRLAQ
jgi:hypothetical protein